MSNQPDDPRRRYSAPVVDGVNRAASRAMLRAVGFDDEDFARPQVGIASTWSQVTPCNSHIDELAAVARGAQIVRVHDVKATADALKVWQAVGVFEAV